MPMLDYVAEDLAQEDQSDFHKQILKDSCALVDMSRRKMSQRYAVWDRNDRVFRGERCLDVEDKQAIERKEPEKMIVPIAYSQIMTLVSFFYSLYTQRERFFELLPMKEAATKGGKIGEALLARDLSKNCWEAKLFQFLLDVSRFSMGVVKTSWVREQQMVREQVVEPPKSFLFWEYDGGGMKEVERWVTSYEGNRITNVSPYKFFPDVRLPISRFQEGEFIGSEDEYTITTLQQWEAEGEIQGVKFIKPMTKEGLKNRGETRAYTQTDRGLRGNDEMRSAQSAGTAIITEVQRAIVPKDYKVNGKPLGKEDYPVKYVVLIANDSRVLKCEPMDYVHNQFTYDVAEFTPDQHAEMTQSLSDIINMMQDVISWLINSRITNVRKIIGNRLVVDPSGVEFKDIEDRKPVIRLKPHAAGKGVDKWVHQLELSDVTVRHIEDVKFLIDLVQITTGISDNLMGQFNGGRRSATEARNVQSSAAARLKMQASTIFRTAIEPMGRKMLSNLQDGLSEETLVRVVGMEDAAESDFVSVTKADIAGAFDFEVFDGTLPSEKGLNAQTLVELLGMAIKSPEAALSLGLDVKTILMEALELRGIRNPKRFTLKGVTPEVMAQLQQMMQQQQQQQQQNANANVSGNGNGAPVQRSGNGAPRIPALINE